jgi:hypothetical protein
MAPDERPTLQLESLTQLHWIGIVLAAITGVIHLWLAVSFVPEAMGWSFLVAALGFLLGIVGVLTDYRRRLLYLLGIPFTAGQIPAWYVVNAPDLSPLGIGDKIVQVALIVVLIVLYRRERS